MLDRFRRLFPGADVRLIIYGDKPAVRIKTRTAPPKRALSDMFDCLHKREVISRGKSIIIPTENYDN